MGTRIISLALALCVLLSACGGRETPRGGRASLLARAAEVEDEEILLVVGGREIPAWRYLYWLAWACDRLQRQYDEAEIPLNWEAELDGGTLADYARDCALADTGLCAAVESWAEEHGILPEEAPPAGSMPELGLGEEQMAELERVGALYGALYDAFCTPEGPLAPQKQTLEQFAREEGWLTVQQICIPYGEDREAARQQAAELFARLNGAEDQAAAFHALAEANPALTLRQGEGTLERTLEEAAAALEVGQCSGILEAEEGFVILQRQEAAGAALMEACFDHLLQQAAENASIEVTEAYLELDTAAFYGKLQHLREEMS